MEKIGKRLKALRAKKKLTQAQAAAALKTSESGLQNYERGIRKPPCDILMAMADFYGVSVDYILGRVDDPGKYYSFEPGIAELQKKGPALDIAEQAYRLLESNDDLSAIYQVLSGMSEEKRAQLRSYAHFLLIQDKIPVE
ncbi:MAG: helix-turn-helix domain-containing protein [Christensenellales bacterium]|jgi:transcriptional regulator with XRE-family HTH domain